MWFEEEMEAMDTSDTPWWWHYLADCGRWHRVEVSCFEYFLILQSKRNMEQELWSITNLVLVSVHPAGQPR